MFTEPKLRKWMETTACGDGYSYVIPPEDLLELKSYIWTIERDNLWLRMKIQDMKKELEQLKNPPAENNSTEE